MIYILSGFICSAGFYYLFYKLNRPEAKWRSNTFLFMVIFLKPLVLLIQSRYSIPVQSIVNLLLNMFILGFLPFLVFILLGKNKFRMFVASSFVFCIASVAEIINIFSSAILINSIIDLQQISDSYGAYPLITNIRIIIHRLIMAASCFLAAYWLRKTQSNPPQKYNFIFSMLFILFTINIIIMMLWLYNIKSEKLSISVLFPALFSLVLLAVIILTFYFYTRLIADKDLKTEELKANEYEKYIQLLSKRELELVEALTCGNGSYKELAAALNISVHTIKTHLKHIYKLTNTTNLKTLSALFSGYNIPITPKSPQTHP